MTNKHQEFMKSLRSMMLAYEADKAMDEKSSYRDTESANAADDEDISFITFSDDNYIHGEVMLRKTKVLNT